MKFHIIIGQRNERYAGEYAPEALDVIDEVGNDDNPDFLQERLAKARDSGDFERVQVVTLDAPTAEIMKILRPQAVAIPAKVSKPAP